MSSPKKMAEYLSAVRPTKRRRNLLLNGTKQSTNPWQHGTKSIGRNIKRQNSIKRTVKTQILQMFSTRPNSAAQRQGSETMWRQSDLSIVCMRRTEILRRKSGKHFRALWAGADFHRHLTRKIPIGKRSTLNSKACSPRKITTTREAVR